MDNLTIDYGKGTMMTAQLRIFEVVAVAQDDWIAGMLGDTEWVIREDETQGYPICRITTDDADALIARLRDDDNVCNIEELVNTNGEWERRRV